MPRSDAKVCEAGSNRVNRYTTSVRWVYGITTIVISKEMCDQQTDSRVRVLGVYQRYAVTATICYSVVLSTRWYIPRNAAVAKMPKIWTTPKE